MSDFNDLPAHVWPRNAQRQEDGVVTVAGVPLPELVEEFGSPVMVVDEDDFRSRCQDMAAAFGAPERVHYAGKAFLCKRIAQWVNEEGLALDVASHNELKIALAADFPANRITVHGNNKSNNFLTSCVTNGVGHVVLDSSQEIELLDMVARKHGTVQRVLIRVTPGVDAHTHEFIATSHEDQKFGISLATGEAFAAAQACLNAENLELVGLHCHVGSQVFDAEGFKLAAERILGLYKRIHNELGMALEELDLGGGFGIPYIPTDTALDVNAVAQDLLHAVQLVADELEIDPPTVLVEPGRAIAGPSTVTAYEIGTVKDVVTGKGDVPVRRYFSVDGGLSDNIRPALYGADYDARVVGRFTEGELIDARIVGSHCESGDILIEEDKFPSDVASGDYVALAATGAYCYSMSSRYNAAVRPAVVAVRAGNTKPMLRRETIEDILALDVD
ncbi:diaminopimelate decarboxylase [Corynebacterium endometrii]|uniref:Diaminopimelate decarboxylase n=1 Tax=Corynebacterium endometrii TaxID=2488819 RepID=A0A4P7QFP6_9CORY|nr:diaminopimelate decarboxylase [Corynebacterium endometrii]QCB28230.1 Diaminopimelate decarboxylase [Corynebacterium endometrii]